MLHNRKHCSFVHLHSNCTSFRNTPQSSSAYCLHEQCTVQQKRVALLAEIAKQRGKKKSVLKSGFVGAVRCHESFFKKLQSIPKHVLTG